MPSSALRNRVAHAYFHIDHEIVWKTAAVELPQLLVLLRQALAEDDDASSSRRSH